MRLIDADVLLKRVDEEREYLKGRGLFGAEHILVHNFRELVDNAPTVEIPNYGGQIVPDTLQGWRYEERPQGGAK